MTCGDDMVLIEAMPAEMGGVQGFEMQTHHCPACRGTERRFIFVRLFRLKKNLTQATIR
jgi:hypothetical protein